MIQGFFSKDSRIPTPVRGKQGAVAISLTFGDVPVVNGNQIILI